MQIIDKIKICRDKWQAKGDDDERQQQDLLTDRHFAVVAKAAATRYKQKPEYVLSQEIEAK